MNSVPSSGATPKSGSAGSPIIGFETLVILFIIETTFIKILL